MQTNDFETRVQQQLEQLKIAPGEAVWERVAFRIKKERKRKRFVIWFFAGLFLLAGGAGIWTFNRDTEVAKRNNTITIGLNKGGTEERRQAPVDVGLSPKQSQAGSTRLPGDDKQTTLSQRSPKATGHLQQHNSNNHLGSIPETAAAKKQPAPTEDKEPMAAPILAQQPDSLIQVKPPLKNAVEAPIGIRESGFKETRDILNGTRDKQFAETSTEAHLVGRTDTTLTVVNPVVKPSTATDVNKELISKALAKKSVARPKSKWQLGMGISVGASDNVNKLKLVPGTRAADLYASPGSSSGLPVQSAQKFVYYNGRSTALLLHLVRMFSNRWTASFGIDYHYYSVRTRVGIRREVAQNFTDFSLNNSRAVSSYYQTGLTNLVSNRYYTIGVPVQMQYNVRPNKAHSFRFALAFTPSYIVASNVLYYNRTTGTFYREDAQLKRMQTFVETGFAYNALKFRNFDLNVGPVVQYGLSNLTTPAVQSNEHLLFLGIKTNVLFTKLK